MQAARQSCSYSTAQLTAHSAVSCLVSIAEMAWLMVALAPRLHQRECVIQLSDQQSIMSIPAGSDCVRCAALPDGCC